MEYREFRAEGVRSGDDGKIHGLVTPFDRETVIGDLKRGGFKEIVRGGAFKKTFAEGDQFLLNQHRMDQPLARRSAGNLELREGELDGQKGVVIEADPVDTSYGRDLRALVDAKVVTGMSFGFEVVKEKWTDDDGKPSNRYDGTRRELLEVRMFEASAVTLPAYGGTSLSFRDAAGALADERAKKPYGNETYADPKNGKYPLTKGGKLNSKRIHAAWSYINMPKNAEKYPLNGVSLASVKAKIKAAAKKIGMTIDSSGRMRDLAAEGRMKKGSAKRVIQTEVELKQALALLDDGKTDDAKALIAAAAEHIGHIKHTENVGADGKKKKRSQEPDSSTPEDQRALDALAISLLMRAAPDATVEA